MSALPIARTVGILAVHVATAALGLGFMLGCGVAVADSVEEFYRDKAIELYIGYTPGGGYDAYARLVARHMGNHIPGRPKIVPHNMPGGGSRVATNYVYSVAARNGTVLATGDQSLALEQALKVGNIQFDTTRFSWIGNVNADNNTLVTWHTSGIKTIEDARIREVPVGATGADPSSQYPKIMNALLGTKFKVVLGYPGANEINLAMENGEVAGRGSNNWASWKATKPDWLRDKKINILVQIGMSKAPDLAEVPLLMELGNNAEDIAVLKLLSEPVAVGRPLFTTPDVPPDRVKALRDAFDATVKDPAFLDEAKKMNLAISPTPGAELQRLVVDIVSAPKTVTERLSSILGSPPAK
jgi:tripartite-type tricarboxylate transporter receptor subunit TctC